MTAALLLLAVGLLDPLRSIPVPWVRHALRIVVLAVVAAAALGLADAPVLGVVVVVGVATLWQACAAVVGRRPRIALVGAAILVAVVVGGLLLDRSVVGDHSVLARMHEGSQLARVLATPSGVLAALGCAAFLVSTANVVVRAVLDVVRSTEPGAPSPAEPSRGWSVLRRGRPLVAVRQDPRTPAAAPLLGGRVIGPLERLLVAVAVLAGAPALAAGLLAAKGVVRFPEISADGASGAKAEEFLVGTLASMGLTALVVLVMVASAG